MLKLFLKSTPLIILFYFLVGLGGIISYSIFGTLILLYGYYKRNRQERMLPLNIFLLLKGWAFIKRTYVFLLSVSLIAYLFTYVFPIKVPTVEMVSPNGKIVVIQGMSHLAEASFYKEVGRRIEDKKKEGFEYYFEGIKTGTPENNEKFSKLIGMDVTPEMYAKMTKLYGLTDQGQFQDEYERSGHFKNVDMNIDSIVMELQKRGLLMDNSGKIPKEKVNEALSVVDTMNPLQLFVMQELNKLAISTLQRSDVFINIAWKAIFSQEFHDVLMTMRNDHVINEIVNSSDKKIFITYGMIHVEFLKEELMKKGYGVVKTTYLPPLIKNPYEQY